MQGAKPQLWHGDSPPQASTSRPCMPCPLLQQISAPAGQPARRCAKPPARQLANQQGGARNHQRASWPTSKTVRETNSAPAGQPARRCARALGASNTGCQWRVTPHPTAVCTTGCTSAPRLPPAAARGATAHGVGPPPTSWHPRGLRTSVPAPDQAPNWPTGRQGLWCYRGACASAACTAARRRLGRRLALCGDWRAMPAGGAGWRAMASPPDACASRSPTLAAAAWRSCDRRGSPAVAPAAAARGGVHALRGRVVHGAGRCRAHVVHGLGRRGLATGGRRGADHVDNGERACPEALCLRRLLGGDGQPGGGARRRRHLRRVGVQGLNP